jgi:DNA-directed DNA polymerase III PolC
MDGAIPAEVLPHYAAELGYEAVAMTDHDSLLGAVRFASACRKAGVKPIYGAELTLSSAPGIEVPSTLTKKHSGRPISRGRRSTSAADIFSKASSESSTPPRSSETEHVTLIAKDAKGYANLCRLISDAHLGNERGKPSSTFEKLAERAEGLFVLSGCERSEVARLAAAGLMPEAIAAARKWRNAIGEGYRIEVFDHRGYGHRALRDRLLAVAREAGVRAVGTNDVHYAGPWDAGTHEVLHAMHEIVPLSKTQALRSNSEYYLKDPGEMRELFADVPEIADETLRIAEECSYDLDLNNYHFPEVPIPSGESPTSVLARRCFEGAARRYGRVTREVDDRLQHELNTIFKMGFAAFFLLVADIVDHTRHVLGVRCACRGSAAGSLVCYVLGISDVDPVRYDLLFERFMNFRREEIPDIDVDVESHRREDVLKYILDTYGAEQTAICCMVDTFRARMAIRDVGKALGLPPEEIDVVAKAFPRVSARAIEGAIDRLPELQGSNLKGGQLEQLFELCLAVDGFPRHLALHPSGVILSSPDLADRVPMQESFQGFTMLQADKDDVEELGLAKLDVLGVRMFSTLTHASAEITRLDRWNGVKDLDEIPRDDDKTFELIRSSRTLGCFQIESPGQRELLARFQPTRFEDLIVDISLFRPGPVKSDMISPFLDRRHGFEDVEYLHPCLRPALRETNGVVVYHEQVIRVIAAVTGCSLDDADYVRRHLDAERPAAPDDPNDAPKKKSSSHPGMGRGFRELPEAIAMGDAFLTHPECDPSTGGTGFKARDSSLGEEWAKNQRVINHGVAGPIEIVPPEQDVARWFITSAIRNGFPLAQAQALWKEVFAFASFGFCKSHAAAFALPTYISAWLKAHYPAEFYAGVLTHDPGMYPRRLIVADARQFGVPILPIDVNASDLVYRVEPVRSTAADLEVPSALPQKHSGRLVSREADSTSAADTSSKAPSESSSPPPTSEVGTLGVRLALSEVKGISESEMRSIVEARAAGRFTSLEDLWRRAELSRPVLENLVHVGALDSIEGGRSRRELLWRAVEVSAEPKPMVGSQLTLGLDDPTPPAQLKGLRPYTPLEETQAELEISGIDARRHIMDLYRPLMSEVGCVFARDLHLCRNDSEVWVAGVKVSTQTPAIRSGQRIIFLTMDDPTGPLDVTVFERVQARVARTVFHSWLVLVKGVVRKRGGASMIFKTHPSNVGLTVVAQEVFDLAELSYDRAAGFSLARSLGRQRRKQAMGGLVGGSHPAPNGLQPASKLWHASGGSAGR